MGANATGVDARVTRDSRAGPVPDRLLFRATDLAVQPAALATIAICLLLAALASALWFERVTSRDRTIAGAAGGLDLIASLAVHELQLVSRGERPTAEHLRAAIARLPEIATAGGHRVYLSDDAGYIVGSDDRSGPRPAHLADLFGENAARPVVGSGSVVCTALADGTRVMATIRGLPAGHLVVLQPSASIFWNGASISEILPAFAGLSLGGLALLTFGCQLHARRAAQAGRTCSRLRSNLETALARGRCGLWDWDLARGRISWSASLYEMLGYEQGGQDLSVHEACAIIRPLEGTFEQLVAGIAAEPTVPVDQDVQALSASGDLRRLRIRADLVLDPHDRSRHVVGIALDVTEERREAEARVKADSRLREALEALSEAFVLWDADDRLILCNSKYRQLHGFPAEVARPGTPFPVLAAASVRPMTEPSLAGPASGPAATRKTETQLPNGRWLQVSERRTRDGGVVSVETDVSDLKRNEERLLEAERRLKKSVRAAETKAQRLALIAEQNFEANLAKTEFLARLSHELRTPLTAIIGFADMMRQEVLGPLGCGRYSEYTRDIHASGIRLLEVIEGILQMSRIEAGQVEFAPELMTVSGAVEDALAAVARDIKLKGLVIDCDVAEPALIHLDGRAFHEILVQILRNACTYTEPGGTVRIRARPAAGRLNIFVADDGVGIHPEILPRLGRPYEQIESEYCRASGGTGLGLAIARSLVEMHDGSLRIRSEPGTGTVVLIHLPLVQAAANDSHRVAREIAPSRLQLVAGE